MAKRLGDYATNPDNWEKYTVTNQLHLITPKSIAIIFDCGTEDFFYKVNTELHDKMVERNIEHDFIVRPGAHNWQYWSNAVNYELLYFSTFFKKNNPQVK